MHVQRLGRVILLLGALVTIVSWLVSPPMAQVWWSARAPADPNAQFEARGVAEAALWTARFLAPAVVVIGMIAIRRDRRIQDCLVQAARGLWAVTSLAPSGSVRTSDIATVPSVLLRCSLAAACLLALVRGLDSVADRIRDWPVYRFRSGAEVLPNMSESNQYVIQYLQHATPEDAGILIISDQKLFFLSYYLLPRRVYHRTHPDSEFVVPQPFQQRQMAAYQLSDLTQDEIDAIDPDYVLEYFEGAQFIEGESRVEDVQWVAFVRALRKDSTYVPPYRVVLRPRQRDRDRS